jgi:hypothetical protein
MATREFRLAEFNQGTPPTGHNFYCSVKITTVRTPCRSAASGAAEHGTELRRLNRWKQKWLVGDRGGIKRRTRAAR